MHEASVIGGAVSLVFSHIKEAGIPVLVVPEGTSPPAGRAPGTIILVVHPDGTVLSASVDALQE